MTKTKIIPEYKSALSIYQTQCAIGEIKRTFEDCLSSALSLSRVSAPLFVDPKSGLNDDLNGIERAVEFDVPALKDTVQVVHSLAKWKRLALYKYGFPMHTGLYTDMSAIRRDEEMDHLHSIYVDQWDYEFIIEESNRNLDYLKETVTKIVAAVCKTKETINKIHPELKYTLAPDVTFVTTQELEDMYPTLTPKERENEFVKKHKTVFVMQIGDLLKSGVKHDGRAPDYDDWALNGDILFYNDTLDSAFEVSSMGIRVSKESLASQLVKAKCEQRSTLPFHTMIKEGVLPFTLGGGIGQSRLCMLLLEKAHIGEVQVSLWDDETYDACKEMDISLL